MRKLGDVLLYLFCVGCLILSGARILHHAGLLFDASR